MFNKNRIFINRILYVGREHEPMGWVMKDSKSFLAGWL